jgi:predicted nucleotidyltransferase
MKGLMERVRIVNEDDFFLYRVTTVVLYGSYLRGAERPADVDP